MRRRRRDLCSQVVLFLLLFGEGHEDASGSSFLHARLGGRSTSARLTTTRLRACLRTRAEAVRVAREGTVPHKLPGVVCVCESCCVREGEQRRDQAVPKYLQTSVPDPIRVLCVCACFLPPPSADGVRKGG